MFGDLLFGDFGELWDAEIAEKSKDVSDFAKITKVERLVPYYL